jgi:beta-phosphoglucomutase
MLEPGRRRYIEAVIFDLDAVITDSSGYNFRAWNRLASEEGIPFTWTDDEKLCDVSHRKSLELLLAGRKVSESQVLELINRRNSYYQEMLQLITPKDLLPGVSDLLEELRTLGIKIAFASVSKNASTIVSLLDIQDKLDALADGSSVSRQKPAPDLFLYTSHLLGVAPSSCLVVDNCNSGIEATRAAGMISLGLGHVDRVGAADLVLPNLEKSTYACLSRAAAWRVSETSFTPENQHHHETIFTIGNGYLSTRGSLEERYPNDRQATFIHGMWDDVPIGFTELANSPDWLALDIWVDGHHFDMREGLITDYARYLDLRTGKLFRRMQWTPGNGQEEIELVFERFTSLADQHVLAMSIQITPLSGLASVQIRAQLDSHVDNEGIVHWNMISQFSSAQRADIVMRTRQSDKTLAMSMRLVDRNGGVQFSASDCRGCPGIIASAEIKPGQSLKLEKITSIYTSRDINDPLEAAKAKVDIASSPGYATLQRANVAAWGDFWEASDLVIEGDDEAQLAVRHSLFQLRIAAPTNDEYCSIAAKTLSGFGYRGHVFWDNEIFILPFFTFTQPKLARNLLMYRHHTLPGARRKAAGNGFKGAQYSWESAESGDEITPTWVPHFSDKTRLVRIWTGDIEIHITADIAYGMHQYWQVTGDDEFWREVGVPLILETAVFWGERVEKEGDKFAIRDIIGPDEYHDHVDNNAYTNRLVQWHLETAIDALDWLQTYAPKEAARLVDLLEITPALLYHWQNIRDNLIILQDGDTGLIEQFEGFFRLKEVDWQAYKDRNDSMQFLLGIEGANESQVLKQADVIMLLCLLRERYNKNTWRANWKYYNLRTDHNYGSSLSPAMYAWAACEMGETELAYEHFMRAARADLANVRGNTKDGIHAASAGGLWQAAVFGFAGLCLVDDGITLNPQLPAHWTRLAFRVQIGGNVYQCDIPTRILTDTNAR